MTVTWPAPALAQHYTLMRRTCRGVGQATRCFGERRLAGGERPHAVDRSVTAGRTYRYRVTAWRGAQMLTRSAWTQVRVHPVASINLPVRSR